MVLTAVNHYNVLTFSNNESYWLLTVFQRDGKVFSNNIAFNSRYNPERLRLWIAIFFSIL